MKKLTMIAGALVLALAPATALAGQILPNLYASEYCSLRRAGVSKPQAMEVAMRSAWLTGPDSPTVTIDGRTVDVDVLRSAQAVQTLCPEYQ